MQTLDRLKAPRLCEEASMNRRSTSPLTSSGRRKLNEGVGKWRWVVILYILWKVRRDTYIRINEMHTFAHSFIPFKLSSTCFEQTIVLRQEVISVNAVNVQI